MIALGLQLTQEHRNHAGGPLVIVVKQQHAFAEAVEPAHCELQFGLGRHLDPVGGPQVDAENADVVGGEPVAQVLGVGEAGEAEERRMQFDLTEILRLAAAEVLPVGRLLDRDHALENVGPGGGGAHEAQGRLGMGVGMVSDGVALQRLAPRDPRQAFRVAADVEEGGADALVGQRVEDFRGRRGVRPVVEGDDHLMVGERDRLRIALEADLEAAMRSDGDDSRRAELVRPAFARRRGARAEHQRNQRARDPH